AHRHVPSPGCDVRRYVPTSEDCAAAQRCELERRLRGVESSPLEANPHKGVPHLERELERQREIRTKGNDTITRWTPHLAVIGSQRFGRRSVERDVPVYLVSFVVRRPPRGR